MFLLLKKTTQFFNAFNFCSIFFCFFLEFIKKIENFWYLAHFNEIKFCWLTRRNNLKFSIKKVQVYVYICKNEICSYIYIYIFITFLYIMMIIKSQNKIFIKF